MINDLSRNLNTNMGRMDELQRQLSTGRKINQPSDDPAGLVKSLRLRSNLVEGKQYQDNIGEGESFMDTTDSALSSVNDIMQRVRELTVKAATGTNDTSADKAIADEIAQLNEQLKIVANTTYGSKQIFAGTNVTEAPYQNGVWTGNDETLQVEIGQGVKLPVNIKEMKEFFMGRLNNLDTYVPNDIIRNVTAQDLQEGAYTVKTDVVSASTDASATEAQSYLSSISKNGSFFYQADGKAATLGAGKPPVAPAVTLANDSAYNGSLMLEVKSVIPGVTEGAPRASLTADTTISPVLTFDKPLYSKDTTGTDTAISNGDLTTQFTYQPAAGSSGAITTANYDSTTGQISFSITGTPATGDTIVWNNNTDSGEAYSADGKPYAPVQIVYNGTKWEYDDNAKVTVDLKGHLYTSSGECKDVQLKNIQLNMETANGAQLFKIPASAIDDPAFTDDLVIWNNSGAALGGIDPTNPQINVGDKTVIALGAAGTADSQKVTTGYTYKDINGKVLGQGAHDYTFADNYFDNQDRQLKFFTLNQETGLSYDGSINVRIENFGTSSPNPSDPPAASFDYQTGVFAYMDDLVRKVEQGKLPQVGNELAGNDLRLNEVLLHRATIGARVNRLDLQKNRLDSAQEQLTDLLSKTEDANEAEVIMNLKMQENVYNASLSAGARIIQPTLIDFLR